MDRRVIVAALCVPFVVSTVQAADPVLIDGFNNGIVTDSDSVPGFWNPRLSGSLSAATETGGSLRLNAGGSTYPHGQIASPVQSSFNFFRTPIIIQGSGLNFTSPTGSLNKSIFRTYLSSRAILDAAPVPPAPGPNFDDSEYWADDVLALRIESGNNTPGQYNVALGIKQNYPAHNTEYDGYWLFNPFQNPEAVLPGPVRSFTLAYGAKFWDLTLTHDTSPTDPTPVTQHFTGSVDQLMSNWHDPSDVGPLTGDSSLVLQNQLNNAGATEQSTASLDQLTVSQLRQTWQGGTTGNWSSASNWSDANILHVNGDDSVSSVPNFIGANVRFGPAIAPIVITTDLDQTVGAITFDSAQSYRIEPGGSGQGTIQLDTRWFHNEINVLNGNHEIFSPISVYKDTTVTVTPSNSVLTLSGPMVAPSGPVNLAKDGQGTLEMLNVRLSSLTVSAGTVRVLPGGGDTGTSKVAALTIAGGTNAWTGRFDSTDSSTVIDYSGSSPMATVVNQLKSGYASGAWTGTGINSSSAAAAAATNTKTAIAYAEASALGTTTFGGQTVDADAICLLYTLSGDATMDRSVNGSDFNLLATNFGGSDKSWRQGDFTYDGLVNSGDFNALASNFGKVLPSGPGASVPEPAMLGLAALTLVLASRRRRER